MVPLSLQNRRQLPVWVRCALGLALAAAPAVGLAWAEYPADWEEAGVYYAQTPPHDAVTRLQQQLDTGKTTLAFDKEQGYLPAVLKALRIPISSQMLVFSKTSIQRERISPQTPRALYFNDTTYVGWIPNAPVLEVASLDPQLGVVYYILLQRQKARPRFFRHVEQCLECHRGLISDQLPGNLMRSVYPDAEGTPLHGAPAYLTTDDSPFRHRWGGWYVTGKSVPSGHMGNRIAQRQGEMLLLEPKQGETRADLHGLVDTSVYPAHTSDIVALMVLGHQTHLQNLIIKTNYQARLMLGHEEMQNRERSRPAGYRSASLEGCLQGICEPLVKALLFSGEARLTAPIVGSSGFAAQFAAQGPHDRYHRSLRVLDLKHRLMRYPCSYTIYSAAFDSLPAPAQDYIYRRLWEVLRGKDHSKAFAHLSKTDRRAIREILTATKPGFASWAARNDAWKPG